jgi:outer membrane lipoprotein carrier protein
MSRLLTAFASSIALAALLAASGRAAEPTASDLAEALQRKYDAVKDFSADFVHTYQGGVLKKQLTERGTVLVKKPGKMRWDYASPEKKQFVSDGAKVYFYIPADKQVIVSSVPPDASATTPALFLAGKGRLTSEFTPSFVDLPAGLPAGSRALKLVPKSKQPDYDCPRSGDARHPGSRHNRRARRNVNVRFYELEAEHRPGG